MKEIAKLEAEMYDLDQKLALEADDSKWVEMFIRRSEILAELNAIYEFEVEKNEVH